MFGDSRGQRIDQGFQLLEAVGVLEGEFGGLLGGDGGRRRLGGALGGGLVLGTGVRAGLKEAGVLADEVGPAAGGLDDVAASVQRQGRGGQPVDEVAVVADQDQGAVIALQQLFQLVQRVHVQIVGRFVEDQHIGGLGQCPGQQQAVALAARQGRDRLAQLGLGEQEVLGVGGDMFGHAAHQNAVAAARGQGVPQGHVRLQPLARLVQIDRLEVRAHAHRAFVGRQFAQQGLDQGGLARAVGTDDAQTIAADDARGQVLEQGAAVEAL